MIISSTEFQQNIGKYLELVDENKELIVRKYRPKGYDYRVIPVGRKNIMRKKFKTILSRIRSKNINFNFDGDGVKYQRKVRS